VHVYHSCHLNTLPLALTDRKTSDELSTVTRASGCSEDRAEAVDECIEVSPEIPSGDKTGCISWLPIRKYRLQ